MAGALSKISVQVLSKDKIRINFTLDVTVQSLLDIDNYIITPITSGANNVVVQSVNGLANDYGLTHFVDLGVSTISIDSTYRIEISNIYDANGMVLNYLYANFIARKTKTDSILNFIPSNYGVGIDSVFYNVLQAIAIEDEKMGGQDNLAPIMVPATYEVWGSFIWGTFKWGG